MELNKIRAKIQNCYRCKIAIQRQNVVFGEGSISSSIFLLGEAPAKQEDKEGRCFVGSAGRVLDEILEASGFKRDEIYISNCIKCKTPHNREPTRQELENCKYWLRQELEIIKPKLLVLLGSTALRNILDLTGVSERRGKMIKDRKGVYYITFHPAVALYKPEYKPVLIDDFRHLKKILESGFYKFLKGANPLDSKKQPMGVVNLTKKKTQKATKKKTAKAEEKKQETTNSKEEWLRVANIDRYTGTFKPNQKNKHEFEGAEIQFNIRDVIAFLDGKKDWILLGSDSLSGKEEGKNGIFLNLSQNKKALTFCIDRQEAEEPKEPVWYNIPIKAITEFGGQWIGVFRTKTEADEVKEEKKK